MHSPSYVCQALHRFHPQLRLAWLGRDKTYSDELNPGSFCVVQLYHISDVGTFEEPKISGEFWDVQTNLISGQPTITKASNGPIFNRWGGSRKDWDPLFRIPVMVATIDSSYTGYDGHKMSIYDIYSLKFLLTLRHWSKPIAKVILDTHKERIRDLDSAKTEISTQIGKDWWKLGQKHQSASDRTAAYKFIKPEIEKLENKKKSFGDTFKLKVPKNAKLV